VSSLPDNLALRRPKAPEEEEEASEGSEEKEEDGQAAGPDLMEQLKMSFAKLRRAERDYKEGMDAVALDIEQVWPALSNIIIYAFYGTRLLRRKLRNCTRREPRWRGRWQRCRERNWRRTRG
jgi:hypothetical protein